MPVAPASSTLRKSGARSAQQLVGDLLMSVRVLAHGMDLAVSKEARNGYRFREWDTRAGTMDVAIWAVRVCPGGCRSETGSITAMKKKSSALDECWRLPQ